MLHVLLVNTVQRDCLFATSDTYIAQLVLYADLDLLREVMFAAGAASRWRFDGSVEADDEGAAVTAEQLGMCCSDADGVITCV